MIGRKNSRWFGHSVARVESLEPRRLLAANPLDPSFGSGGTLIYDPGPQSANMATAVQSDGKLLIAGRQGSNAYLARLNADGSADTSFGTGGITKFDLGDNESFNAIAVLPEGKILVAGSASKGSRRRDFLVRYNTAGQLDTGTRFGQGDGIQMLSSGEIITAMTVSGSKFFTIGDHLRRHNIGTGTLDTGFNSTGQIDVGTASGLSGFSAYSVAVSPAGKIAVGGAGVSSDPNETKVPQDQTPDAAAGECVVQFTAAGAIDTTFDSNGVVFYGGTEGNRLAYASDNTLFVAAFQFPGREMENPGIFHLQTNGAATFTQSPNVSPPEAIGILSSGKVVVIADDSASRFTAGGAVDTSFAGTGAATANLTTFNDSPYGLFADNGGAAVGADGSSFAVNYFDRGIQNSVGPVVIGKFLANPPA